MMSKEEVKQWLDGAMCSHVAVDDGGLCLVGLDDDGKGTGAYCEIGGVPLDDELEARGDQGVQTSLNGEHPVIASIEAAEKDVHKCDNCGSTFPDIGPMMPLIEIQGLGERLDPGSTVPAGECPECGALCYLLNSEGLDPDQEGTNDKTTR